MVWENSHDEALLAKEGLGLKTIKKNQKAKLARARERCPHLDALAGRVTEFAKILTGLHGGRLDDWITSVEVDD